MSCIFLWEFSSSSYVYIIPGVIFGLHGPNSAFTREMHDLRFSVISQETTHRGLRKM